MSRPSERDPLLVRPSRSRSRLTVPLVLAGCLTVVSTACSAGEPTSAAAGRHTRQAEGSAQPETAVPSPVRSVPATSARRASSNVRAQRPTSVRLPDGRTIPVASASTRRNGVLDVPDDVATAGWWDGSARVGDPFGAVLLAAHVDSVRQGLGPFAQLLGVGPGARVSVGTRSLTQAFQVRSRQLIPRSSLPDRPGLMSAAGDTRLVLVTCAGPYDRSRGGYQNLAVVTAAPVAAPRHREED